jgi:hypothetical protein
VLPIFHAQRHLEGQCKNSNHLFAINFFHLLSKQLLDSKTHKRWNYPTIGQCDNRTIYVEKPMYMQQFHRLSLSLVLNLPPLAPLFPLQGKTPPAEIICPCNKRIKRKNNGTPATPQQWNNKTIEQCIRITDGNAAIPPP